MANKKNTAAATVPDEALLAAAGGAFNVDPGFESVMLPRIGFKSQDVTEEMKDAKTGKKKIEIITEAGTFSTEKQSDEEEDVIDQATGKKVGTKKVWESEEIGTEFSAIIVFNRKQLKYYDEANETFTSSPVYDNDDEVIPLFCNKAEVHRGTPAELKAQYAYVDDKGKDKSRLEDNRILYIIYDGELYQLNLRGSSMYSFLSYVRSFRAKYPLAVPTVMTHFSSEPMEKGTISWNKIMFEVERNLDTHEVQEVIAKQKEIQETISERKAQFAEQDKTNAAFAAHQSGNMLGDGSN